MSMKEWAKREVEIACKKENPERKEGEFDYGCACYESALKAFNSLLEDGHSGASIGFTKNILVRLIEGKPLTQIEDTDDVWNFISDEYYGVKVYQCKRMASLFKRVHPDGTVTYRDIDRVVCIDINNQTSYRFGFVRSVIDEIHPMTMPYYPYTIKVYCEDFLVNKENGDFDTVGILKMLLPGGDVKEINKFYKEDGIDFQEITYEEYCERKSRKIN